MIPTTTSSRTAAPLRSSSRLSRAIPSGVTMACAATPSPVRVARAKARLASVHFAPRGAPCGVTGVQRRPVARASSAAGGAGWLLGLHRPSGGRPPIQRRGLRSPNLPRLAPSVHAATPSPPRPEMSQTIGLRRGRANIAEGLSRLPEPPVWTMLSVSAERRPRRPRPCHAHARWLECCTSSDEAPRQLTLDEVRLNEGSIAFASP